MIANKMAPARQQSSGDEIFQLQMELSELRRRLKVLDGGAEKSELLDLLKERDDELEGKNKQLRLLNDKFRQITEGLQKIEEERQELRASHAKLEEEKKHVDRHLDMREKEVVTIAQRCATLEEKIQESVPLRVAHQKLQKEKDALAEELQQLVGDLKQLEALRKELGDSKAAETKALKRVRELEQKNKANSDNLIATISKLEKEKFDFEENQKELGVEIAKLKASREEEQKENKIAMERLRDEIQRGKEEVGELEERLKEYGETITTLRKSNTSMKDGHAAAIKKLEAEYAKSLGDLNLKHGDTLKAMEQGNNAETKSLLSKVEEKDVSIGNLTNDLATERQTVENLKSQVEKERSEGSMRTSQHEAEIEKVSAEQAMLSEQLEAKCIELNNLESSLADTNERNAALSEEVSRLMERVAELEGEVSNKSEIEEELDRVRRTVEQLRDKNASMKKDNLDEIANLRQDLEDAWVSKADVEKDLSGKLESLQKEKDAREEDLTGQLQDGESHIKSLEADLTTLKGSIEQLVQQNAQIEEDSEQNALNLRQDLESQKLLYADLDKELNGRLIALEEEKTALERTLGEKLNESRSLVGTLKSDLAKREKDISSLKVKSSEAQATLQKDVEAYIEQIRTISGQLKEANATIARKDAEIDELKNVTLKRARRDMTLLRSESSDLKKRITESEMEAAEIVADLEAQIEAKRSECSRLQERVTKTKDFESLLEQLKTTRLQVNELLSEVEKLELARDQTKGEHSKLVAELELEIDTERTKAEALQVENEKLQVALDGAKGQITSDAGSIEKMQALLNDRTKLLGDMVTQNKDLEVDLLQARALVTDLQAESDQYLQLKDAADLQRDQLKTELEQKEDHYLDAINRERQLRDKVENDLASSRAALHRYRQDIKNMDDLRKENTALKDKVKRQEAYLKRKLEKEKVSRVIPSKAPVRSRYSNGSTGSGGGGSTTSRKEGRAPLSELGFAASSSGSYPEDELDEILQDDV